MIEDSIRQLLGDYCANPLWYLREGNLQMRLASLMLGSLGREFTTYGRIHSAQTDNPEGRGQVARVQCEMKVGSAEKSDIIVLRQATEADPVKLIREVNGHLDVIARLRPSDVDIAVEIKAACSADRVQRDLFRKDVRKLAQLQGGVGQQRKLECHFLLIDKSIGIPPQMPALSECKSEAVSEWHRFQDDDFNKASPREIRPIRGNDLEPELVFSDCDADRAERFVHVWDLDPQKIGAIRHRIVVGN